MQMDHGYLIHGIRCMFLDKYFHLAPLYVQLVDMCKSQEVSMHSVFDPPQAPILYIYIYFIYDHIFAIYTIYLHVYNNIFVL